MVVALLLVAAGVRALRVWSVISWAHWDETNVAVPAIQILGGTFPVHHVGVEYHGAAVAYALAPWFAVAGTSTAALDTFCYLVGLGFVGTSFLVARRVLPPGAALATLAVLAAPPLLLAHWSLSGNLNYPLTLVIGNLLLLGTHTVFFRRPGAAVPLLGLGILAGVGWWSNPLAVLYLAPFAVLALRTGLVGRAVFWLFPLGVVLGGLPDWIYEAAYYPSARLVVHEAGSLPAQSLGLRTAHLFGDIALALHGAKPADGLVPPLWARAGVMALGAVVILRAAVRDRAQLRWLVGAGGHPGSGLGILWVLPIATVLAVLLTQRTLGPNYLLPLYGVLPIWTGECLWWLWCRRRWVGGSLMAALLAFHLWRTGPSRSGARPAAAPRRPAAFPGLPRGRAGGLRAGRLGGRHGLAAARAADLGRAPLLDGRGAPPEQPVRVGGDVSAGDRARHPHPARRGGADLVDRRDRGVRVSGVPGRPHARGGTRRARPSATVPATPRAASVTAVIPSPTKTPGWR